MTRSNLDAAHERKKEVYKDIEEDLRQRFAVSTVEYSSVTLSWRGIWSRASAEELLNLCVIRRNALKVLSSRAIIGGLAAFHHFNRVTTVDKRCT